MTPLKISPTRSNLLIVRQRLKLARQGHNLLNSKREVLTREILRAIDRAEAAQRQVDERYRQAYEAMQEARAAMGTQRVQRTALSRIEAGEIRITPRSIMGVEVPSVHYEPPRRHPLYGLGDTSAWLDLVQREWAAALGLTSALAEAVTTVWLLAQELRRTQRRVNALANIFIPSYEETLAYIEDTLAEKDREEFFRIKLAKAQLSQKQAAEAATMLPATAAERPSIAGPDNDPHQRAYPSRAD
jgi:V/A-type H+-transporting ATPase subunit D